MSNVLSFPSPNVTIHTTDESNWFTEAITRIENGQEPFEQDEE
jgi:hypothetical protein